MTIPRKKTSLPPPSAPPPASAPPDAQRPPLVFGVFGGSFDPPHISHVLAALWALETGEVDRVLVIPCAQHALGKPISAGFDDRLELCRLAFARLAPEVEILDLEGRRARTSYTIDTLLELDRQRPGHRWRLLIGSDILAETHRWKDWDRVERQAPPLVVPRLTGSPDPEPESKDTARETETPRETATPEQRGPFDVPALDLRRLSSTDLRERLRTGAPLPPGLLPASVAAWIRKNRLYGKPR